MYLEIECPTAATRLRKRALACIADEATYTLSVQQEGQLLCTYTES